MALVTVSYGENVIHESGGGETFTLNTEGTYCEEDIIVVVDEGEILPEATGESF